VHPQIERLLRIEIDRVNADLARVEQIKTFRILPKALDPEEEGEPVTPTRKVKRKLMYERFRDLVDGMYDDSEERLIAAGAGDVKLQR
jgi:long-chain acyl-CoA synthetase